MGKLGICAIAAVFVASILVLNAAAEFDLDTIDVQILDVKIQKFETNYQKNSDLFILKLNFINNGDTNYGLKNAKNQAVLVLAPPDATPDDVASRLNNKIIEYYEYVDYEALQVKFDEYPELGKECEWIDFGLSAQESKKITVCYEVPITTTRSNAKRIDDNQYFFMLDTSSYISSCPNCKAISLKDVVEITIEENPTVEEPEAIEPPSIEFHGKAEVYLAKHYAIAASWYKPGYENINTLIAGDVVNLSPRPVTDIILSARTFKNGESQGDTTYWYPVKKILRPGEASPFFMEPLLSNFDDYEISVSNFKFSDTLPNEPSIDIIELDVQRYSDKWDTYTIKCTESGVYPHDLSFVPIWYDESGYVFAIEFFVPEYPDKDDCRLNGNKTSDFPYFDLPTDNSFEFFLMEGNRNFLFTAGEPGGFNPTPYGNVRPDTYSKYYPDSLRPKYMDGITKIESFLKSANLEVNKPTIIEETPETNLPKLGTYNILVHEMPKNWEKDYGTILDSSLKFWEENYDEIKFNYVTVWEDADFSIEWASTFSIEGKGILGYYGCCDDYGANKVVITLGHFDEDNNWIFTERDYAEEILKHEIGHALGLKHTQDQDDIMYYYIYDYKKWQELDKIKKQLVTDESKPVMPDWIRNNAKWWAEGKIEDNEFVSGIQFLIKEKIMQIPQTAKGPTSAAVKEIPAWIKNNADWWSQGLISDDDFVKGIQYLVEQGIIKV